MILPFARKKRSPSICVPHILISKCLHTVFHVFLFGRQFFPNMIIRPPISGPLFRGNLFGVNVCQFAPRHSKLKSGVVRVTTNSLPNRHHSSIARTDGRVRSADTVPTNDAGIQKTTTGFGNYSVPARRFFSTETTHDALRYNFAGEMQKRAAGRKGGRGHAADLSKLSLQPVFFCALCAAAFRCRCGGLSCPHHPSPQPTGFLALSVGSRRRTAPD